MRVLHVIPSISPCRGGPSQAVLAMAAAQRRYGLEASILTTNDDGPALLVDLPLHSWHRRGAVPVLAFPRWSPPLRPLREFAIAPGMRRWLHRHGREYDLLHVHALFSYPSTMAMAMARQLEVPYILRTIGQLQHWSLRQSSVRKQLMLALIERRNLEGAAALHFTSPLEQQEASALGLHTPGFVLPLGVETPAGSWLDRGVPPLGTPVQLLFLSRLHPKKQLPLLLEALALLRRQKPEAPWLLHIAGDGDVDYGQRLKQQARALGIADALIWHGFVAGDAKTALFDQADWFVLPSAAENFGIAAAEALAHGLPVLLAPGVALADAVVQAGAGFCVEPSIDALSRALIAHALTPPSASMRQAACRLAAEQFSWPAITQSLAARYQAIAATSPLHA